MIQSVMFRSLWAYRGFILANVRREFQQRYTHSLLGGLWAVLNPLTLIVIYTVIFAGIMHPRLASGLSGMRQSVTGPCYFWAFFWSFCPCSCCH